MKKFVALVALPLAALGLGTTASVFSADAYAASPSTTDGASGGSASAGAAGAAGSSGGSAGNTTGSTSGSGQSGSTSSANPNRAGTGSFAGGQHSGQQSGQQTTVRGRVIDLAQYLMQGTAEASNVGVSTGSHSAVDNHSAINNNGSPSSRQPAAGTTGGASGGGSTAGSSAAGSSAGATSGTLGSGASAQGTAGSSQLDMSTAQIPEGHPIAILVEDTGFGSRSFSPKQGLGQSGSTGQSSPDGGKSGLGQSGAGQSTAGQSSAGQGSAGAGTGTSGRSGLGTTGGTAAGSTGLSEAADQGQGGSTKGMAGNIGASRQVYLVIVSNQGAGQSQAKNSLDQLRSKAGQQVQINGRVLERGGISAIVVDDANALTWLDATSDRTASARPTSPTGSGGTTGSF